MKITILIFTILFANLLSVKSQILTVQELLDKSKCKDYTCFNNFITQKGFSFLESHEFAEGTDYLYNSNDKFAASSNTKLKVPNTSIFILRKNGTMTTGIRTALIETYNLLVVQIETLGFVATSTKNVENGIRVNYTSKSYPKILIEVQTDRLSFSGETFTSYDIEVTRSK